MIKNIRVKNLENVTWKEQKNLAGIDRNPEPRSMKRGNKLVGYGMATGIWDANRILGRAEAIMTADGKVEIKSAVTDIGTGTKTIMTQIAADELGLSMEDITFSYADSKMPFAPIQGGSFTTATVGPAVQNACQALNKKLFEKAKDLKDSVLKNVNFKDVIFKNGFITVKDQPEIKVDVKEIFKKKWRRSYPNHKFCNAQPIKVRKKSQSRSQCGFR